MPHLVPCRVCLQPHQLDRLDEGTEAVCVRCGAVIGSKPRDSLHRTAAFSLAAILLYAPANLLPVIRIEQDGMTSDSTVLGSAIYLWDGDDHLVAIVVFLASFVIPILKLLGLAYLVGSIWANATHGPNVRTWVYRGIDSIGRWAMLDVFVLGVLVSVVKLDRIANVSAGPGALPFVCVVGLTLAATLSFDPRLIWLNQSQLRREQAR